MGLQMYVCNEENENNGARARKQLLWARVVVVVTYVYYGGRYGRWIVLKV